MKEKIFNKRLPLTVGIVSLLPKNHPLEQIKEVTKNILRFSHTGSFVYQCAKGKGYSIINGKRFDWKERDIFCVPSWAWHEHHNLSESEDACLFCFNDLPVIEKLGLYQSRELEENNGHQII